MEAQGNKQICSIKIMFPIDTDDQAIDCKKKIAAVLANISNVHLNFSIIDIPDIHTPFPTQNG